MKLSKNFSRITLLSLILSVGVVSCSKDEIEVLPQNEFKEKSSHFNRTTSTYDGKALFKGIVFSEGEVGKKIYQGEAGREFRFLDEKGLRDYDRFKTDMVSYIDRNHPSFFKNFKRAIIGGNHVIIEKHLDKAYSLVKEAFTKVTNIEYDRVMGVLDKIRDLDEIDLNEIAAIQKDIDPLGIGNYAAYSNSLCVVVAVVVNAVAVANDVAVVEHWYFWIKSPDLDQNSGLAREELVNAIVHI